MRIFKAILLASAALTLLSGPAFAQSQKPTEVVVRGEKRVKPVDAPPPLELYANMPRLEEVALSPTEYNLLRYLLVNQGRVVSKAQILDHVWDYDFGGDGGVVETYIGYLRRKLDQTEPKLIQTIRGVGYTLRPPKP